MLAQVAVVTKVQQWIMAVLAAPGVTPTVLEGVAKVDRGSQSKFRRGLSSPRPKTVSAISRVVGTDADEVQRFFSGERADMPPIAGYRAGFDHSTLVDPPPLRDLIDVPLFVGVPASTTEWTEEYPHGHFKADPRQRPTFAVRVVGGCMKPFIPPGSTIVASRPAWEGDRKTFRAGVEYVVCLNDGRMTFKVAQADSEGRVGWFRLEPYNKAEFGPGWNLLMSDVAWAAKVVQINKG